MKQYDYNKLAKYYDVFEADAEISYSKSNLFINSILKKYKVKTLLDFTCGTGAQAIYLSKHYDVVANDLSRDMLKIAKTKARAQRAKIKFTQRDIRYAKFGKFDAVITIFNAIGHLDENQFDVALENIRNNLKKGGIYIFDIFNLDFIKAQGALGYKFLDVSTETQGLRFARFNHNSLDSRKGIFKISQETWIQKGFEKPMVREDKWDMKIYSANDLNQLLKKNKFKVLRMYGGWGKKLDKHKCLSIVVVAQKQ